MRGGAPKGSAALRRVVVLLVVGAVVAAVDYLDGAEAVLVLAVGAHGSIEPPAFPPVLRIRRAGLPHLRGAVLHLPAVRDIFGSLRRLFRLHRLVRHVRLNTITDADVWTFRDRTVLYVIHSFKIFQHYNGKNNRNNSKHKIC